MKHRIGITCVLLLLSGAWQARAEEPAQAQDPTPVKGSGVRPNRPDPQLKHNPMDVLRAFQPPADEEYRLGRGDEITVDSPAALNCRPKTGGWARMGASPCL